MRILLIDGGGGSHAPLLGELGKAYPDLDTRAVDDRESLARALESGGFDLAITDFELTWADSRDVFRALKSRWPECPVVLLRPPGASSNEFLDPTVLECPQDPSRVTALVRAALDRDLQPQSKPGSRTEQELEESRHRLQAFFDNSLDAILLADDEGRYVDANPAAAALLGYSRDELLRMSIWDVVLDPEQARKLWPNFLTAGQLSGACVVVRKDGTTRHVEFRARANVLPGLHVSSNHDITERKRAEEEARLLQSITLAVSAAHDFGAALGEAMKQVREATGWAFAEAWLPRSDGTELERHTVSHSGEDGLVGFQRSGEGHTFAPGIGLPGTAWSTQRPVWIPDVTKDPRFDRIAAAQKAGLKAAMAVPALAGEEVVAVLSFFLFEPREEDERLVRVVQTIGTQLGWIIQRRRAEQERRNLLERERAARAEAEAALQRLRAIQSVTDAALAHLALDDLLGEMLARLSAVLAADSAAVLLLSEDGTSLFVRAVRGLDEAKLKGFRIPMGSGIAGSIAARREPLMIEDVSRFPIVSAYFRERVRSLIGVPLLVENQVVGVLQVGTHQLRRFSQEDLRLLQLVADRVAPTIDRARLYEQGRESRERLQALSRRLVDLQEAERREIAGELHDEVGQLLTGLRLLLESRPSPATTSGRKPGLRDLRKERASRRRGPAKRHPARRSRKQEMQDLLNDLMGRIRDMSMNLRPPMLDSLGLLPALLWHFGRYTSQTGVRVEVRHTRMDRRFAREVEMAAFRIVQEALTNVARHAGVDEVAVEVSADRQRLRIQVQDRGRGFAPASALAGPSSGLTGMRERAQLLGGVLNIASAPGAGTRLLAELPLRPSGAKRRRKA